jgi:hypothetical protein
LPGKLPETTKGVKVAKKRIRPETSKQKRDQQEKLKAKLDLIGNIEGSIKKGMLSNSNAPTIAKPRLPNNFGLREQFG